MTLPTSASDPVDAPGPSGRRRLPGPAIGALIALGLVILVLGVALGVWGARLYPATAGVPLAQPVASTAAPATSTTATPTPAPAAPVDATPPPSVDPGELGAIEDRLQRVERQHRSTVDAAAAALAAADLSQASETSRPFGAELEAAAVLIPNSPDLVALRSLAAAGAPARSALSSDFDAMAARAAVASRSSAAGSGFFAEVAQTLASMVHVRRVDRIVGTDPDAVLARTERRLAEGDLASAVRELDGLPPRGREAASGWRSGAERRLQIERRLAAIRAAALRDLTAARRGSGA